MPSDKFFCLDDDKKMKIIEASKKEFINNNYEDASINKIIQSINMPRGTFYLYFENKQDLYLYILKEQIKSFKMLFIEVLQENNNDIFDSMISFYDKSIKNNNDKDLFNNIFINMNSKQLGVALPQIMKEEMDGSIIKSMNVDKYNISCEEKELLLSILIPLFLHAVAISLEESDKKDIVRAHYLNQLNIIKRGLERKDLC